MIETRTDPISVIAYYNGVKSSKLRRWYKDHLSGIDQWEQASHHESYLLYPQNFSARIAIDEVSLAQGELVTMVTNRLSNGRKGKLIAMINGTKSANIQRVLELSPKLCLSLVQEVTLDMANNMEAAMGNTLPQTRQVTDRFHVIKLVNDAMQHLRITHRWKAIEDENNAISAAKKENRKYIPVVLSNGDTPKQLLARARYILFKTPNKWSQSQAQRAQILFSLYPDIKNAYYHVQRFRKIYEVSQKTEAKRRIMDWIMDAKGSLTKEFQSAINSILNHLESILNFFDNRSTNAAAESFNAQIKAMRATQKGVSDYKMFLFRIEKLFT